MSIISQQSEWDTYIALTPKPGHRYKKARAIALSQTTTLDYIYVPSPNPFTQYVGVEVCADAGGVPGEVLRDSLPTWSKRHTLNLTVSPGVYWFVLYPTTDASFYGKTGVPSVRDLDYGTTEWYSTGVAYVYTLYGEIEEPPPPPAQATNPTPTDNAWGVKLNLPYLQWECETEGATFDVYFKQASGEAFGFFTQIANDWPLNFIFLPDVIDPELVFPSNGKIPPLTYGGNVGAGEGYYWRVDTRSGEEVVQGDVWSFSTISFAPPLPDGLTLPPGTTEPTGVATGRNAMKTLRRLVAFTKNSVFYET
ncbi:MAG: hypothetical protein PHI12_12545 [Dehalococcoidales bacterium]|nr:hypothetical protein [Dehalococcoidales bacterium]